MSAFFSLGQLPGSIVLCGMPPTRGRQYSSESGLYSRSTLPDDAVGVATVAFSGVVSGSEIRVYNTTGEVAGIESCVANQVLAWPVYASGSPNNNVQIKIIHTAYSIMDFHYPSSIGSQSIPVQQEPDKWYLNPA